MQEIELKIVGVSKAKKKGNCFVNFSNGEWVLVNTDLILKFNLQKDKVINQDIVNQITYDQNLIDAKQRSLNYATYKPRTEKQVRDKLKELKFLPELIETCINFLYEFNYLDDEKFAFSFAKDYKQLKPASGEKIRQELLKRGICKLLAEKAVSDLFSDEEIVIQIEKACEKKLRMLKNKPKEKMKSSLISFLQRQGFEWELIKQAINKYDLN
ncbi:MAG: RecX family transcriptional regulator [Candidatus Kapabacteria bacterium]|nr:RecX family transcriptional regulator [Candidatus Kapabacteria bacterium]